MQAALAESGGLIRTVIAAAELPSPAATPAYALSPDVLLLLLEDGTARLLDLDGDCYAISDSGAAILDAVLRADMASSAQRIASHYHIDSQQVAADMSPFLRQLERKKAIRPIKSGHQSALSKSAPWLVFTWLRLIQAWPAAPAGKSGALLTLAYCSHRLFGWARTVSAWRRHYSRFPVSGDSEPRQRVDAIDRTVRAAAARHPLKIDCKERALCAWALTRAAGLPAMLILGVELFPLGCHCWCQLGSRIIADDEDRCQRFTPVAQYD